MFPTTSTRVLVPGPPFPPVGTTLGGGGRPCQATPCGSMQDSAWHDCLGGPASSGVRTLLTVSSASCTAIGPRGDS